MTLRIERGIPVAVIEVREGEVHLTCEDGYVTIYRPQAHETKGRDIAPAADVMADKVRVRPSIAARSLELWERRAPGRDYVLVFPTHLTATEAYVDAQKRCPLDCVFYREEMRVYLKNSDVRLTFRTARDLMNGGLMAYAGHAVFEAHFGDAIPRDVMDKVGECNRLLQS